MSSLQAIREAVSLKDPRSFFLYAGAGSGKTAQLIAALKSAIHTWGAALRARDSRICVITFTNAASEEIQIRLGRDPLVDVSTIHSFAWRLIRPFTQDIAETLRAILLEAIAKLEDKEAHGRSGTQASNKRRHDIRRNTRRLEALEGISKFSYSPSQASLGSDGLAHSEVLDIAARLLREKPLLQELLIGRYPFLFIDEVQDTNRGIMDAVLSVQKNHADRFCVGLFGDTMQRIYPGGNEHLESVIDGAWRRPEINENYRSSKRIVELANSIRKDADGRTQIAKSNDDGVVRLFVANDNLSDKSDFEAKVQNRMAILAEDTEWTSTKGVKTLILEHSLAAERHGFNDFYRAFEDVTDLRQRVFSRNQSSTGIVNFLGAQYLPLIRAVSSGQGGRVDKLLREYSPLLSEESTVKQAASRAELVATVRDAVDIVRRAFTGWDQPIFNVLEAVHRTNLLMLPDTLAFIIDGPEDTTAEGGRSDGLDGEVEAWRRALNVNANQVEQFYEYIVGGAPFDTHQGVKGLEFPRVVVILDDKAAGGFQFSYGKMFGTTQSTVSDYGNASVGRETTSDRTLRLFYVVCSRAKESLAIVLYSPDPRMAKRNAVRRGWFVDSEVLTEDDMT